jgi:hypothetical protein
MKTRPLSRIQKTLDVLRHQGANIRDLHVLSCLVQIWVGPRHGPRALRENPAHKHLTLRDIRAADCCLSISRDRAMRRAPGKTRLNVKHTKLLHQGQPNVKCLKKRITSCSSYSPKLSQAESAKWQCMGPAVILVVIPNEQRVFCSGCKKPLPNWIHLIHLSSERATALAMPHGDPLCSAI